MVSYKSVTVDGLPGFVADPDDKMLCPSVETLIEIGQVFCIADANDGLRRHEEI
ncbi:hypothetical protein [Microvirga tunisiensis]|uniref:hypothetical protein n=1 Tax=Microvirga tunisiensis TaxID=2108360 RepID=UPI00129CEB22|nr:hypothetical protein [Microvirga tunisiensis]